MRALATRVVENEKEVSVRDALPGDLGLPTLEWRTPPLLKGQFSLWVDYTLPPDEVLVMYGIAQEDADPAACGVRVCHGDDGQFELNMIALQRLYAQVVIEEGKCRHEAMLAMPIYFDPAKHIQILVGSREDKPGGDKLIPLFLSFKPRGPLVVPEPARPPEEGPTATKARAESRRRWFPWARSFE
jgi:hypothetical protein